MNIEWVHGVVKNIDVDWKGRAQVHQNNLTKPPGSLGMLEEVAIRLSAMNLTQHPSLDKIKIVIFAADHGIAEENVSAFPQAVTVEMIRNFSAGGAAISVLAKELGADLEVVNVGTVSEHEDLAGVIVQRIDAGTKNFSKQPAMTEQQLAEVMSVGQAAVERAKQSSIQLFIAGDMGIANTTPATAISCALLDELPQNIVGPGTGLDKKGIAHKAKIIEQSLNEHQLSSKEPLRILQCVGGFEIAAITATYIACAQNGIPALVDGFIASAAALAAIKINPQVKDWLFFAHASAEPGHKIMMHKMDARPLVDLNLRLGEASGAAVVVPMMRMACAIHNDMATFEQAGVSNK